MYKNMNKNLFRLGGSILTLQALYIIIFFSSLIARSLCPEPIAMVGAGLVVIGVRLLLVSAIGALLVKKWAVPTLWISLILSFVVSVFIGHSYPAFISGGFLSWVSVLIIVIFFTIEWKKSKLI